MQGDGCQCRGSSFKLATSACFKLALNLNAPARAKEGRVQLKLEATAHSQGTGAARGATNCAGQGAGGRVEAGLERDVTGCVLWREG